MIRNQLDIKTKSILDNLVVEGKPEHPDFLSWMSGVELITDESPYPESELSKLTPNQLFEIIKTWNTRCERYVRTATDFLQRFCS